MPKNNLDRINWLIGQWEGIQGPGIYHEEWNKASESELKGKAYLIKKGEIVNTEILSIRENATGIFYIADVSHNPSPVSFKLTNLTDCSFIFENPEHDFPQKITYENKDNQFLYAAVEAVMNGKIKKIEYNLKRIA